MPAASLAQSSRTRGSARLELGDSGPRHRLTVRCGRCADGGGPERTPARRREDGLLGQPQSLQRARRRGCRRRRGRTAPTGAARARPAARTDGTRPRRRRNSHAVSVYGPTTSPKRSRSARPPSARPSRRPAELALERRVADDDREPRADRPGIGDRVSPRRDASPAMTPRPQVERGLGHGDGERDRGRCPTGAGARSSRRSSPPASSTAAGRQQERPATARRVADVDRLVDQPVEGDLRQPPGQGRWRVVDAGPAAAALVDAGTRRPARAARVPHPEAAAGRRRARPRSRQPRVRERTDRAPSATDSHDVRRGRAGRRDARDLAAARSAGRRQGSASSTFGRGSTGRPRLLVGRRRRSPPAAELRDRAGR